MYKLRSAAFVFSFALILASCGDDKKTKSPVESEKTETNADQLSENNDSHNHKVDSHDGHDHDGHDHEGHSHVTKPKAIENNTRVRVPAEKKPADPTKFVQPENNPVQTKEEMQVEFQNKMQSAVLNLPEPCGLLTDDFIGKVIGVDKNAITLKDGSSPATPYARSCFFRWDHLGTPNSGVLIQVQDNPVPDEFPDWAPYYIQAKRNQGEKSPDGSLSYKYKKLDGLGVDGAYSFELHRYLWRDAKNYVYLIAFNLPSTEGEELEWAKKLGAEVMKNAKL
ncbi:MAG: hypothetical protein HKO66_15105 [Saprospiraceae bacterium]|nr:hypothetical protein [Bacteroidia bacterium]NNL93568.1 hypothetical protein [Saprospiraceae bacterium]